MSREVFMVGRMGGRRTKRDVKTSFQGRPLVSFNLDSDCGRNIVWPRIVGGTDDQQWPWMASIGYYSLTLDWVHKCGGTLIDGQRVLAAAHCVRGNELE